MKKICIDCLLEKEIDNFYRQKSGNFLNQCKSCKIIYAKRWTHNNIKRAQQIWRDSKIKNAEILKIRNAQWKHNNPDKVNANTNERRAKQIKAIPKWANRKEIRKFYKQAKVLKEQTGISYHVDHIIPLRHLLVCGLHCEENLQVLTSTDNVRKHNTFKIE